MIGSNCAINCCWFLISICYSDFLDRKTQPRMPWHDVACCVFGAAAGDVARHFVQRYNQNTTAQSLPVNS